MIFTKKKRYEFHPVQLLESTAYLPNPSMGWYHIYSFCLEKEPDFEELFWCLEKNETLALVLIDIGNYQKTDIPEEALMRLHNIFQFFVENKKEMIVRVTYDTEGNCAEREPEFLSQLQSHMEQIGSVLQEYKEQILLVQGLCIGNWGEMHGSKFLTEHRLKKLYDTWRKVLGKEMFIAVRTPLQWRLLHDEADFEKNTDCMGVFNDGMFASPDDLGTYRNMQIPNDSELTEEYSWTSSWPREKELAFLQTLILHSPYGGEAVGEAAEGDLKKAVEELRQAHAVYLNKAYDAKRLELWKQEIWKSEDVWNGIDGMNYIGNHLGYRLVIRKADLTGKKRQVFFIDIENIGFAAFAGKAVIVFSLEIRQGMSFANKSFSVPRMEAGTRQTISFAVEELLNEKTVGKGMSLQLKIRIQDSKGNCIRLANAPDADFVELGSLVFH